jgi:hypothetical protein
MSSTGSSQAQPQSQADVPGDITQSDNLNGPLYDDFGKLVIPTEPVNTLSLAFRTLHMRRSSVSCNDLQTICELTPAVYGTGGTKGKSGVGSADANGTSTANNTVDSSNRSLLVPKIDNDDVSVQGQGDGLLVPITSTQQQQHDAEPRKYHPSKESQPQEGSCSFEMIDHPHHPSRTNSAADRLLQEATQYAEALGERPPRHFGEISRQIIDDDDDQFASDDDDEHGPLSEHESQSHDGDDVDVDLDHDGDDSFDAHGTSLALQEPTKEDAVADPKSEQLLPPGTPVSKMVEELLTATHGGHNITSTRAHLDLDESAPQDIDIAIAESPDLQKEEDIVIVHVHPQDVLVDEHQNEAVTGVGVPTSTKVEAEATIAAAADKASAVTLVHSNIGSISSRVTLPLLRTGSETDTHTHNQTRARSRTDDSCDLSVDVDTKPSNNGNEKTTLSAKSHDGSVSASSFSSSPPSQSKSQQSLTQRNVQLQHRSSSSHSHSAIFGKYMLNPNPRPLGKDGKPSDDAGYVYQGIKFNPPEVTKRGTQRGNHAQLHRKAWLEVSDKYHRYGKNLRAYYKEWERIGHPYQMFFDWLDSKGEGAGEPLPNLPECPRMQLDRDTVLYINDPDVQESYRLTLGTVCKGEGPVEVPDRRGAVLDCNGEPVSTGPDGWIFVLRDNNFYGSRKVTEAVAVPTNNASGSEMQRQSSSSSNNTSGSKRQNSRSTASNSNGNANIAIRKRFHHSSFFAGKAVTAAGIFITDEAGRLKCMYPHSGHYRPGEAHMQRLLYYVQRLGIDLSTLQVDVQQLAHVARKEKVVLHQVQVLASPKEESASAQASGDQNNANNGSGKKVVKTRSKKEKCKKADSLHLRPAYYVAWILTHKAKMLSKGVFGMIQNIRQVRAVSVQEALDAVDNGGFFLKSRIRRDRHSHHNHCHSDEAAATALLEQHKHHQQNKNSFKNNGNSNNNNNSNGAASASSSQTKQQQQMIVVRQSTSSPDPQIVPSTSPSPTSTATATEANYNNNHNNSAM